MSRASCQQTIDALDSAFLTGFTGRAAAALVHLRDAWCNADPTNRPAVVAAIVALFACRSLRDRPERYMEFLTHGLEPETSAELLTEVSDTAARGAEAMALAETLGLALARRRST